MALVGSAGCSLLLFDGSEYGGGAARNDAGTTGPDAEASAVDGGPTDAGAAESFVVVAGGAVQIDPNVLSTSVYVSKVGADGQLSPWTEWTGAAALPEARHRAALVTFGDALLFVGGYTVADGSRGSVYQSTFTPLGSPWITAPQGLPSPRGRHAAVTSGQRLYVTGGRASGGTTTASVLVASFDTNGGLGPFAEARALPSPREVHVALTQGKFLWVLTGYDTASGAISGDGWVTELASDGSLGAFQPVPALPEGTTVNTAAGAATETHLYVVGGTGNRFGRVFASKHRSDGSLEGWFAPSQLLTPRNGHVVVEVNGRLYAIGGQGSSSNLLSSVEVADIAADGSLSAWRETTPLPRALFTHGAAVVRR